MWDCQSHLWVSTLTFRERLTWMDNPRSGTDLEPPPSLGQQLQMMRFSESAHRSSGGRSHISEQTSSLILL